MENESNYIQSLRYFAEYTQRHRGRKFVIHLPDGCVEDENFPQVLDDILFLYYQGIQLILSYGAKSQIDAYLQNAGIDCEYAEGERITDTTVLPAVQRVCSEIENAICARYARSNRDSLSEHRIRVIRGNFVVAKPKGVTGGIDFHHTGTVRKVDTRGILTQLKSFNIILLSPVAYSASGQTFNVRALDVAADVARAIEADKFIYLGPEIGILDHRGERVDELVVGGFDTREINRDELIQHAEAMCRAGVQRFHYVSYKTNGALLKELFSREGSGTQIVLKSYQETTQANVDDIDSIINLIEPLEQQGLLVKRSRDLLELEIDKFVVVKVDDMVVACSALYQLSEDSGELACIATASTYRGRGIADLLLSKIENWARDKGLKQLFVLTTQAEEWFSERGFTTASPEELPAERERLYNYNRNSKVLRKTLS